MERNIILDKAVAKIPSFFKDIDMYLQSITALKTKLKAGADTKSLVTQVDLQIQSMLEKWVFNKFKGHLVFGEEKERAILSSNWVWYIDPIDGTNLFSRNIEEWGIIVSLTYKKLPFLAWVYFPYLKTLYFSRKGLGSFKNKARLHTSKVTSINKSIISGVYLNSLDRQEIMMGKLWKHSLWGIIGRSLARDFCDLAEGKIDIAICYDCYVWEYKALYLLVREAGGICLDFKSEAFDPDGTKSKDLIAIANTDLVKNMKGLFRKPPPLK